MPTGFILPPLSLRERGWGRRFLSPLSHLWERGRGRGHSVSVSYTHLAVYKRQGRRCAACWPPDTLPRSPSPRGFNCPPHPLRVWGWGIRFLSPLSHLGLRGRGSGHSVWAADPLPPFGHPLPQAGEGHQMSRCARTFNEPRQRRRARQSVHQCGNGRWRTAWPVGAFHPWPGWRRTRDPNPAWP